MCHPLMHNLRPVRLPDGLIRGSIRAQSTGLGGSNPVRSTSQAHSAASRVSLIADSSLFACSEDCLPRALLSAAYSYNKVDLQNRGSASSVAMPRSEQKSREGSLCRYMFRQMGPVLIVESHERWSQTIDLHVERGTYRGERPWGRARPPLRSW